jgi:hypothetical protein
MTNMHIFFLIVASILVFYNPLAGFILFFLTAFSIGNKEDKEEMQSKTDKDRHYDLMVDRWYYPLDKKFLKIKKYNHIEWLSDRVDDFEKQYKGVSFFDKSNSYYWSDVKSENTKNLFPDKAKYIKICKFLKIKPVPEILEDWDLFLEQEIEQKEYDEKYMLESLERKKQEIRDAKKLVIKALKEGDSRQTIEDRLRDQFLNVSVKNGEWTIKGTSPFTGGAKTLKIIFTP